MMKRFDEAIPKGMERVVDTMYAKINNTEVDTDEHFASRTILTTTNTVVRRINVAVTQRPEGDCIKYMYTDSVEKEGEAIFFDQDVLNTVNIEGFLPYY